jgi:hypothetical protein
MSKYWTVCASVGSANNMNKLSLVGMQLHENYKKTTWKIFFRQLHPYQRKLVELWVSENWFQAPFFFSATTNIGAYTHDIFGLPVLGSWQNAGRERHMHSGGHKEGEGVQPRRQ